MVVDLLFVIVCVFSKRVWVLIVWSVMVRFVFTECFSYYLLLITGNAVATECIVFVGVFFCFSVTTITREPLHSARWNFARTFTSTTSRTLLNFKVDQRSRSRGFFGVLLWAWCCGYPRTVLSLEQGLMILLLLLLRWLQQLPVGTIATRDLRIGSLRSNRLRIQWIECAELQINHPKPQTH